MKTALEQNREDQALGAAWRRCEVALSAGSEVSLVIGKHLYQAYTGYDMASSGWCLTPTEALTALAEALEAR